jgi:hypothetical protein
VQKEEIGNHHLVLVDSLGKKANQLSGLTDTMKRAVFYPSSGQDIKIGEMWLVKVNDGAQNTLFCDALQQMDVNTYFNIFSKNKRAHL